MTFRQHIILLSCILWCLSGSAQSVLTEKSTPFLSTCNMDSLYESAIKLVAKEKGVSERDLISNMDAVRLELNESSNQQIIIEFVQIVDQSVKKIPALKTTQYSNLKNTYLKAITAGVRNALNTNPTLRDKLLNKDFNDKILSFDTEVNIDSSGKLLVTENIRIYNGTDTSGTFNNSILRGITRDFPTIYVNQFGLKSTVPFKLLKVSRNNKEESVRKELLKNGVRIYIGSADYKLSEGIHSYTIQYETDKQLLFQSNKDELYWNVNGNGWAFTIDRISCKLQLPNGSKIIENDCYTGLQGSKEKHCTSTILQPNLILFQSTKRMNPYEGITIACAIEKGVFHAPTSFSNSASLFNDNRFLLAVFVFFILFVLIHTMYWYKNGRDPKNGIVIPQFAPPPKYSPADVGYVYHQAYSHQLFAATLIDFVVKKLLLIDVSKEGLIFKSTKYSFRRPDSRKTDDRDYDLYAWYGFDPEELYGQDVVSGTYNSKIGSLNRKLEYQLKSRLLSEDKNQNSFQKIFSINDQYIGAGIFFIGVLLMAIIVYATTFYTTTGYYIFFATILLLCIFTQIMFMKIIKAYTSEGRKMADYIHGFRMYLSTAEGLYFNALTPPEKSLELYEKYLPYAIALDVENEWGEQFKDKLELATQTESYRPIYTSNHFSSTAFSSGFASGLSTTISSASTPPSSSSGGSSGGGFSGGGGGGGGGGGW